jgi:hypothetical protein
MILEPEKKRGTLFRFLVVILGPFYMAWESRRGIWNHFTKGIWSWVYFLVGCIILYHIFGKE